MAGDAVEQPVKQRVGGMRFSESLRVSYLLQGIAITLLLLSVPIGATTASAQKSSGSGAHVYFLRGVLNIFSLGLDDIAAKLKQQGIPSTVSKTLLVFDSKMMPRSEQS